MKLWLSCIECGVHESFMVFLNIALLSMQINRKLLYSEPIFASAIKMITFIICSDGDLLVLGMHTSRGHGCDFYNESIFVESKALKQAHS